MAKLELQFDMHSSSAAFVRTNNILPDCQVGLVAPPFCSRFSFVTGIINRKEVSIHLAGTLYDEQRSVYEYF